MSEKKFTTLVVLELGDSIMPATIDWLITKIRSPLENGGSELLLRTTTDEDGKVVSLHVGASTMRLLVSAELMEIKKLCTDGALREFSIDTLGLFEQKDDLDNLLTVGEKQQIIHHELTSIKATPRDHHIPGFPRNHLCEGQSIIREVLKADIVNQMFPLHNIQRLRRLEKKWCWSLLKPQPIETIKSYFGETIAFYFAFLGVYTMALIIPAVVGLLDFLTGIENVNKQIFFAVFNLIWTTLFLESWKRYSANLSYKWGTIDQVKFQEPRPEYKGEMVIDEITGKREPLEHPWRKMVKLYCVSLPVLAISLYVAARIMLLYISLEEKVQDWYDTSDQGYVRWLISCLPEPVYSLAIGFMNEMYRKLARVLNDWENHRLQSDYDNNLILKLVVFEFLNSFMGMFYVAFYLQDLGQLQDLLAGLLITEQVTGQIKETIIPFLVWRYRRHNILAEEAARKEGHVYDDDISEECRIQAELASAKEPYEAEGLIDDYLEMFMQFGYVFLFSSVFPCAALFALINNFTEVRADGFKLCRIHQRPFTQTAAGIGVWQDAFELMAVIAVMTNCALIGLSAQVQAQVPALGLGVVIMVIVAAEHLILGFKVVLAYLIPDRPEAVTTALAKLEYQAKKAWKKQRKEATAQKLREQNISLATGEKEEVDEQCNKDKDSSECKKEI